jgi:hypothetical protein
VKPRTKEHSSVIGSCAEDDYNIVNPAQHDPNFGIVRLRGDGWYQNRRCKNESLFQLRARGVAEKWQWMEWSNLEVNLDRYIQKVLQEIPTPWECPDDLNGDLLYFNSINIYSNGFFDIGFTSPYCLKFHEYLHASFEENELKLVEWIN